MVNKDNDIIRPVLPEGFPFSGLTFLDRFFETQRPHSVLRKYNKDDGSTVIEVNLAGFQKNEISVKFDKVLHRLNVEALRDTETDKQQFATSFSLSPYSKEDNISTEYTNGILYITVTNAEDKEDALVDIVIGGEQET